MLKVKIELEDDSGKKAEIEISESDNLSKLSIIDNVFRLFGIENDPLESMKNFKKISEAYDSFFNDVQSIEPNPKLEKEFKENIKNAYIEELTTTVHIENDNNYNDNSEPLPSFVYTGIKIKENGTKLYKCRYECSNCGKKGTHYIYETSITTFCHTCQYTMNVAPAHPDGVHQDSFGNFYRAGEYKDWRLEWDEY